MPASGRPPGTDAGTGTRKEKAAQTEAALKAAALRLFERHGYLNTKITDITREAGRAAGSFYSHFTSKEQLLEALAADFIDEGDGQLGEHPHDHDLSDPAVLREHILLVFQTYRLHRTEIVAMMQASMVDEGFAIRIQKFREYQTQPLCDHLEQMRRDGFHLPGTPDMVALAMICTLEQFCYTWLVTDPAGPPDESRDDEAIDMLTALILSGIAVRPAATVRPVAVN